MTAAGYATYNDVQCGDRDTLVLRHADLVKRIAYHLIVKLPDSVDVDDLIQAGMIGILEAASSYRADGGASFETFAGLRIRGAMIDHLRSIGWVPRSVSRELRRLTEATRRVEHRSGREATGAAVAAELNITLEDYHRLMQDASSVQVCSLEQVSDEDGDIIGQVVEGDNMVNAVATDHFQTALALQIDKLPEKEKLVLSLYYDTGLNLKEIGQVLDVSESRVCQIHGQAIVRLKSRMADWIQP